MTLTELKDELILLTGRPDLEAHIVSAIRSNTLAAHSLDFFPQDLNEAIVSNPTPTEFKVSLQNPTRFKRWNYIRYADAQNNLGIQLQEESPSNLLNSYLCEKQDVYYLANTGTKLILSAATPKIAYGYYSYPDISVQGFSSWIADEFPYYIIFNSAAKIYNMIGRKDMAGQYAGEASIMSQLIIRNNITEIG